MSATKPANPLTVSEIIALAHYVTNALSPVIRMSKRKDVALTAFTEEIILPLRNYYVSEWMRLRENRLKKEKKNGTS